jgi:hypothetical protein
MAGDHSDAVLGREVRLPAQGDVADFLCAAVPETLRLDGMQLKALDTGAFSGGLPVEKQERNRGNNRGGTAVTSVTKTQRSAVTMPDSGSYEPAAAMHDNNQPGSLKNGLKRADAHEISVGGPVPGDKSGLQCALLITD